jgi:hypothetical protein
MFCIDRRVPLVYTRLSQSPFEMSTRLVVSIARKDSLNGVGRLIFVVDEAYADLAFEPISVSRRMDCLFDVLAVGVFVEKVVILIVEYRACINNVLLVLTQESIACACLFD